MGGSRVNNTKTCRLKLKSKYQLKLVEMESIGKSEQYTSFYSDTLPTACNICMNCCTKPPCTDDISVERCKRAKLSTVMDRPINTSTGFEIHAGYQDTIIKNFNKIGDHEQCENDFMIINRQITNGFSYQDLDNIFRDILCGQRSAFQANLGFGFILQNTVTNEFKYFFDSRNHMLYEKPVTISHEEDLIQITQEISNFDLAQKYYLDLKPSIWIVAGFTNVEIHLSYTNNTSQKPLSDNHIINLNITGVKARTGSGKRKYLFVIVPNDTTSSSVDRSELEKSLLKTPTMCSNIGWCETMEII